MNVPVVGSPVGIRPAHVAETTVGAMGVPPTVVVGPCHGSGVMRRIQDTVGQEERVGGAGATGHNGQGHAMAMGWVQDRLIILRVYNLAVDGSAVERAGTTSGV